MDEYLKSKWTKGTTKKVRAHVKSAQRSYFKAAKISIEHCLCYTGFSVEIVSAEGTTYRMKFGYGGGLKSTSVR